MTLNCIWLWGLSSGYLESVEYLFIATTPRFTLTRSTCKGVKYIYLRIIHIWKDRVQKILSKKLRKKCKYERTMNAIS